MMKNLIALIITVLFIGCSQPQTESDIVFALDSTSLDSSNMVVYHGNVEVMAPQSNTIAFTKDRLIDLIQRTENQLSAEINLHSNALNTVQNSRISDIMRTGASEIASESEKKIKALETTVRVLNYILLEIEGELP